MSPTWTVIESRDSFARVEAMDAEGSKYVSVFSGPRAEAFAREYAAWKNGEQERLMAVLQMRQGLLQNTMDVAVAASDRLLVLNQQRDMRLLNGPADDFEGVPI